MGVITLHDGSIWRYNNDDDDNDDDDDDDGGGDDSDGSTLGHVVFNILSILPNDEG